MPNVPKKFRSLEAYSSAMKAKKINKIIFSLTEKNKNNITLILYFIFKNQPTIADDKDAMYDKARAFDPCLVHDPIGFVGYDAIQTCLLTSQRFKFIH